VAAIGITNQRETVVAWDRSTGRPLHRAIVWQDRRTAGRCDELRAAGHLPVVREKTGLVLDPYFSATKMSWLLTEGGVSGPPTSSSAPSTPGSSGTSPGGPTAGSSSPTHQRQPDPALRHPARRWSGELADLRRPPPALPEVRPLLRPLRGGGRGTGRRPVHPLAGAPVSGVAGDQQAALFGQACFSPGWPRSPTGPGASSWPTSVRPARRRRGPPHHRGLGPGRARGSSPLAYALEGPSSSPGRPSSGCATGSASSTRPRIGPLAASVPDSDGVYRRPRLHRARQPVVGPLRPGHHHRSHPGVGRAHIARAVVEAMAFQVRDVVDAMTAAGGASPRSGSTGGPR
jgi:glycerol kinase